MTWIQTRTGRAVDLLDPRPEDITLDDIAFALSRLCRFTGHVDGYSVAQHCVLVASLVPPEERLAALMHDAAEAYVGDVSRPLKQAMRRRSELAGIASPHDWIEGAVAAAIATRFGLPAAALDSPAIHHADMVLLATERRDLLGPCDRAWPPLPEPMAETIHPWSARTAQAYYRRAVVGALPAGVSP